MKVESTVDCTGRFAKILVDCSEGCSETKERRERRSITDEDAERWTERWMNEETFSKIAKDEDRGAGTIARNVYRVRMNVLQDELTRVRKMLTDCRLGWHKYKKKVAEYEKKYGKL